MAYPTGSGSEILNAFAKSNQNASWVTFFAGTALHIYTVLSLHVCNTTATAEIFSLIISGWETGADPIYLIEQQSVPPLSTYVHSDRLVLRGDDVFYIWNNGTSLNYYLSYIIIMTFKNIF